MREDRRKKAEHISKKMISTYLVQELPESMSEYGLITLTDTKLSQDLSYIDVYVSSLKSSDTLTKYLALYARDIEKQLCKNLPLIKIPRVRFRYDTTHKDAFEIYQKIQELPESS